MERCGLCSEPLVGGLLWLASLLAGGGGQLELLWAARGAGAVVSHGGNYTLSSMLMVGLLLLQILKPGKGLMLSSPFHVCVTFITTFD